MRIITIKEVLTLFTTDKEEIHLFPNIEYVVPDIVPTLLKQNGFLKSIIKNEDFYSGLEYKIYKGQNLDNKTLIFFRNGGIGDLVFPIPSVKVLKEMYPTCKFYVCCNKAYRCLFEELDFIEEILDLPLKLEDLLRKDYYVNFEGLIEGNPNAELEDAYKLHAQRFFVTPTDFCPQLKVNPEVDKKVQDELSRWGATKKKIVIAYSASVPIRSINPNVYRQLIDSAPDNVRWFIIGSINQSKEIDLFIRSCKNKNKVVNWSNTHSELVYTMALIKNSDCVIAPDSGAIHIAGGFGVPVIGLYGAFHSQLRMKHYKKSIGIDAMSDCVFARGAFKSCYQHGTGSCNLARKIYEKYSPCMSLISVDIVKNALELLKIIEFKNLKT